jgi:outer membrane protein TolC
MIRYGLAAFILMLGAGVVAGAAAAGEPRVEPPAITSPALDSFIAEALDRSQELAAIRARIEAAEAKIKPAGALPDPMVSAGFQNIPVGQGVALDKDPMSSFAVMGSQEVPPAAMRRSMRAVMSDDVLMLRATLDDTRNDIVRKVKQSYIDVQYQDEALAIAERNRDTAKDMLATAEARYSTGKVMQQDVFQSQVRLSQMVDMVVMRQRERAMAATRLNRLLYRSESEPVPPLPPLRRSDVHIAIADLRALALESNPRLQEMSIRVGQAARSERVAALGIRPMWSFSVAYMFRQPVEMNPMSGDDMWSATVGMTLPWVYRRDKVDEEVRRAKAQQQAASRDLEAMQNEVCGMVEETVIDIGRADDQLSLVETGLLPQAESAYAASRASYTTGKGEVLDMLMNQMNLYNLELQRVMLLMQRGRAIADVEYTVGGSLTAQAAQPEVSGGQQ